MTGGARERRSGSYPPKPGAEARQRLLAGLPVSQRRVDAGGVSTALLEGGAGSPLLLLHGGIECGGAYWAPVIPRLVENHRVVVPDAPGLGESEPLARLDDETFARWLRELIRLTCEARPTLVAHSLFGTLAARFAAAHGDSLSRLVVYAAPGIGRYRMPIGLRIVAISSRCGRTSEAESDSSDSHSSTASGPAGGTRRGSTRSAPTRSRAHARPHVKRTMSRLIKVGTQRVPDAELQRIRIPAALALGAPRPDDSPPARRGGEHATRLAVARG